MKTASMAGIVLIILGIIALAYQGITYTTHKKVLDIGPIQATEEKHKTIPVPPIVGGAVLLGGVKASSCSSEQVRVDEQRENFPIERADAHEDVTPRR